MQLAHIALTLIGEGEVHWKGEWRPSKEVMEENGLKPFEIHIREGLSITNGTSVMTGIGIVNQFQAVDCLGIAARLSPATRRIYDAVRAIVPVFIEDTPFYKDIAAIENYLKSTRVE